METGAMFGRSRRIAVAGMLILYGSVSFCTFLHGPTHDSESCHHPDHAHGAGPIVHADPHHDDSGNKAPEDCPLCQFLAQSQLTTEPARVTSRPFTAPHVALILAAVATRDRHPACSPRAPPAVLVTAGATA
jgi:hypothetical protein